jgi:hypothetical protein
MRVLALAFGLVLGLVHAGSENLAKAASAASPRQTNSEALATARKHFPHLMARPTFGPPGRNLEQHLVRFLDRHTAQIEVGPKHQPALVESMAPLEGKDANGRRAPVDLLLARTGNGWKSAAPAVAVSLADDLSSGMHFTASDLIVQPELSDSDAPVLTGNTLFWGNAAADSDWLETPTRGGAEALAVLRSADSPDALTLHFASDKGAVSLHSVPVPIGAAVSSQASAPVNVAIGGRVVATVQPPAAQDADGRAVPVTYVVEGDHLTVRIDHRSSDVAYPVLVDPEVVEAGASVASGWQAVARGGGPWELYDNGALAVHPGGGYWFNAGDFGGWVYTAGQNIPEANTAFLFQASLNSMYLSSWPLSQLLDGTASNSWSPTDDAHGNDWQGYYNDGGPGKPEPNIHGAIDSYTVQHCPGGSCYPFRSDPQFRNNKVVFAGQWTAYHYEGAYSFYAALRDADVYLDDAEDPTITSPPPTDTDWTNHADLTVGAQAQDGTTSLRGLGIRELRLTGPASDGSAFSRSSLAPIQGQSDTGNRCTGTYASPCRQSWDFDNDPVSYSTDDLAEGDDAMGLTAYDAAANPSGAQTFDVKVDRTPPHVDVSGPLYELRNGVDKSGIHAYSVQVEATDGDAASPQTERSGVAAVTLSIDGQEYDSAPSDSGCANSCAVTLDTTDDPVDFGDLSEGVHTAEIVAVDRLNHSSTVTWQFSVPRDETYASDLATWVSDVQQRVDDAVPVAPLTRDMPAPPDDWRRPGDCEASTSTLTDCYDAVLHWADDVRSWLNENLATTTGTAADLPDPPVYDYAPSPTGTAHGLSVSIHDAFVVAKQATSSPTDVVTAAVAFHSPRTPAEVEAALPAAPAASSFAITGDFEPGTTDLAGAGDSASTTLSDALDQFYSNQVVQAQNQLADIESTPPDDQDDADAAAEATDDLQRGISALTARDAFVTGVSLTLPLADLADLFTTAGADVKSVQVLNAGSDVAVDGADALGSVAPDAAIAAYAADQSSSFGASSFTASAAARPVYQTCGNRNERVNGHSNLFPSRLLTPSPTYFAPSRERTHSYLSSKVVANDLHYKRHALSFRFLSNSKGLAWECAQADGDRNVEIEVLPYPFESDRWSFNWGSDDPSNWQTLHVPVPIHQDDLACGNWSVDCPNPLGTSRYPDFALVSEHPQAYKYGRLMNTTFLTDGGETNSGRAIYSVQATHYAVTSKQNEYCNLRKRHYQSCMFSTVTACEGMDSLPDARLYRRVDWGDIYGTPFRGPTKIDIFCDPRPPGIS